MGLRRMKQRRIKRLFVLATVVITVTLLYRRNVCILHEFTREAPIAAEVLKKRKFDTGYTGVSKRAYQSSTACPVLSIQSQHFHNNDTKHSGQCKPWKQTEDICSIPEQLYSSKKDIHCTAKSKHRSTNICRFAFSKLHKYKAINKTPKIYCNKRICQGGRLLVGSVNPETGVLTSQDWKQFRSANLAEMALPRIISTNRKNGLSFCLIRCLIKNETIDQLLTFPQHLQRHRENLRTDEMKIRVKPKGNIHDKNKMFTINIVVLDSVSRNHFYRMLPKTVSTLRETALRPDVRVLDYEFLQSLAPYTYTNIKALFTGTIERAPENSLNQSIGINTLYSHFKRHGYRTLFQEDSCWYDHWGTVLENNIRKDKLPQSTKDFKKSWENFRNLTKGYSVDDYGLTHWSCVVFMMHGISNMFNKPLKVCYDGRPISSYFLRYAQDALTQAHTRKDKGPIFSYFHSNIGHEVTGLRIKALDDALSVFLRNMGNQKNTLTIVISDHGPKTTIYSQDYLHGRYETYDSLLFMLIPNKVQDGLGASRIAALVKNQKSLVTMKDVHEMLIEMTQLSERKKCSGLFSNHISNRTCDSLTMVNYGVCKCRDWEQIFIDQSPQFMWLAEFATEILNNKLREQFSRSNRSGSGRCRKLQLFRIWNIRQRVSNDYYITTFDLVVKPFYTIFLVQTKHTENNGKVKSVDLHSWRRVSIYRHYVKCKDKSVDIELCVCNLRQRYSNKRVLRMIKDAKVNKDEEIIKTRTSCLYILLTKAENKLESIFSYDVINICERRYIFTGNSFDNGENYPSKDIVREVPPNTDTFLLSLVVKEKRKPTLNYTFKRT